MALLNSPLSHRVRAFLSDQGAPPSPRLSQNCEQIFALLQRRREDDEFWEPLTELLRDLVQSAVDSDGTPLAARPEARLLALWDVRELAKRLRAALQTSSTESDGRIRNPSWPHVSRSLSPSAFGLFLVFGLAAMACNSSDNDTALTDAGSTGGATTSGGTATSGGASNTGGATASTGGTSNGCQRDIGTSPPNDTGHALPANCCTDAATELWNVIDQSSLGDTAKETLYSCLLNLNATWCDGLVQVFKTASASEIANYLNNMLTCCRYGQSGSLTGDFSQRGQAVIEGLVCGVPLYKGVTFPD